MNMQGQNKPDFFMEKLVPHRIMTRDGPQATGLFRARFYGPVLPDTPDGLPCWFQASKLVRNAKEAKLAFAEWVKRTKNYMKEQNSDFSAQQEL